MNMPRASMIRTRMGLCAGVAFLAFALSCENGKAAESSNATDYSVAAHWMSLPATNRTVDVFYLYPTSWTNTGPVVEYCAIDNPQMLSNAPINFARQATVFEPMANLYAPFYRQANLTPNDPEYVAGIPTIDATAAFDYYIKNYNNGRAFILAGHSQGANVLACLLSGYLKTNSALCARMIAAYVIGYPVATAYLANNPHLKFAEGPGDTGVIISYNTQSPNMPPAYNPILWGMTGIVINPILWTRDTTLATTNQGFGSFMPDSNGVYQRVQQYADAKVDITHGILLCSTADTNYLGRLNNLAGIGVYHNFDYPFYYYNLRSNAVQRIQNYLQKIGADYDADGKADPVICHGAGGVLTVFLSGSGYAASDAAMGDLSSELSLPPISGDFDGDGKADPAVYDPIARQWRVRFSAQSYALATLPIGDSTCVPVSGDYDGDGKADPALYSAICGQMGVWLSGSGYALLSVPLGGTGWVNAAADYDGDSKTDPAVFQAQSGQLQVLLSTQSYAPSQLVLQPSALNLQPAPGDYDGDGKADPAVFQSETGWWLMALSGQSYALNLFQGLASATLSARPGDYDGDGKTDPAVYIPGMQAYCACLSGSSYAPAVLSW